MRAVHLYATEERGEREPKGQAQFNATTVRGGTGRDGEGRGGGVMICSNFKGHTLGHMDDTTNFTKAQALDEALGFGTDLMGRFSLNMATDEIAQVMNRAVDHRIDAMSEDLFMLEMERIVDEWEAGELSLSEATHDLMRLLYDRYPHEAQEHLRDVNPELYEEQEEAEGVKRMDALAEDRCTTHDL